MIESIKIFGIFLGIVAFFWKLWDSFASYLFIDFAVNYDGRIVSAKTVVENKSGKRKKIDNALLLVGPEEENPIETYNALSRAVNLGTEIQATNEIATIKMTSPVYDGDTRALIPLPFYYSENIAIGDERLTYRATLEPSKFMSGRAYSVRFFLWTMGRYHRSTHDSFVLVKFEK